MWGKPKYQGHDSETFLTKILESSWENVSPSLVIITGTVSDINWWLPCNFPSLLYHFYGNLYLCPILPLSKILFDPCIWKVWELLIPPSYAWRNWGSEKLHDIHTVTWPVSDRYVSPILLFCVLSTRPYVQHFWKICELGLNGISILQMSSVTSFGDILYCIYCISAYGWPKHNTSGIHADNLAVPHPSHMSEFQSKCTCQGIA